MLSISFFTTFDAFCSPRTTKHSVYNDWKMQEKCLIGEMCACGVYTQETRKNLKGMDLYKVVEDNFTIFNFKKKCIA